MKLSRCFYILTLTSCVSGAFASGVLDDSYTADKTFTDASNLSGTRMNLAWDGSEYWGGSGGGSAGQRLARYDASGALQSLYMPGLDMRSVFTTGSTVFARAYNDRTIYRQTAPGSFTAELALAGGTLNDQSLVVATGSEYIAMVGGTVSRWDLAGNFLGDVALSGYGSGAGEGSYPNNRGIGFWDGHYLTYSNGTLSAWDGSGSRVGSANLVGAGTSFDSHFSFGFAADNRVWVADAPGGEWRGYALAPVPEPASMAALGIGALALLRRRRRSK